MAGFVCEVGSSLLSVEDTHYTHLRTITVSREFGVYEQETIFIKCLKSGWYKINLYGCFRCINGDKQKGLGVVVYDATGWSMKRLLEGTTRPRVNYPGDHVIHIAGCIHVEADSEISIGFIIGEYQMYVLNEDKANRVIMTIHPQNTIFFP